MNAGSDARRSNLPPPPDQLVGRERELAEMATRLTGGGRSPKPVALVGLGGIGKSTLARAYAHQNFDAYEQLCWVYASGADPSAAFGALADDPFALELPVDARNPERVRAVRARLERGGPHLLVLDNVDHPRSWQSLVPVGAAVHVILTSRREDLAGVSALEVGFLSPDAALALLLGERAWPEGERQAALAMVDEVGSLTLALALAGRLLLRPGARPGALLERLRRTGVVSWSEQPLAEDLLDRNPGLRRLFDTSADLLDEREPTDACALRLLWAGGWFAPVEIPRDLLARAAARLAAVEIDPYLAEDALSRLAALGLVELGPEGNPNLHRLVGAYAQVRGGEAAGLAVLDALGEALATVPAETVALRRLLPLAPHLVTAAARVTGQSAENHLQIALRLAQFYNDMAQYAESLALCARLCEALGERGWASNFYSEGGNALVELGRREEALRWFQAGFALLERRGEADSLGAATALGNIGRTLRLLGRTDEALPPLQRALELLARGGEANALETARTQHAIGRILADQGDLAGAGALLDQALRTKERLLGEDPDTASTCHALGQVLLRQGRVAEATACHSRAQAIRERVFGPTHPNTLKSVFALGACLAASGNPEGLLRQRAALDALVAVLNPDHPEVAYMRSLLEGSAPPLAPGAANR